DTDIRGEIVHLNESYQSALKRIDYPVELQKLLGEALSAVVLLSATLKFSGRLSLQIQGEGIISLLLAQVTHDRKMRALINWKGETEGKSFRELVGKAHFAITIEPDSGQRYQGIVPLAGENLCDCLEKYFTQSEQLPTRIWLRADSQYAAGLLLQKLPGDKSEQSTKDWEHVTIIAETITTAELLNLSNEEFLYRLYHDDPIRLFDEQGVEFKCVCSKEKCEEAISTLGKEEIQKIIDEKKIMHMNCEFCGSDYQLDIVDLTHLLKRVSESLDGEKRYENN
ncbi:Hsp33 family molecular chaperone HslO, partial [bacterium]|nr:Hsp33 family molecular chaperone HslO [bacterium]